VNCASCGRTNRANARFCGGCGASLAPRCPACGAASEPDSRFCDACGAALAAGAADDGVARKVVTILFADLIGSTALHERLDPESVSRLMEGYHRAVRAPVEAHGGSVVQLLGDGVMCAFGVPRAAEDDALRAVRAAVDVQRAFREFAREQGDRVGALGLRVALNTGEVVVSDDYAAGIGDPLNVAARLQQEARDGDILLGEATQRLVAGQVTLARVASFALKGRTEPVTAYRVVSLERPAGAPAIAFVGREDELRRLGAVFEAAVGAPATRLAVLLGSPGLGKSRLLAEFAQRLGERATVLGAACNAAGGATFAPLADALRAALEEAVLPDEAERARIAGGIGALLAGTPAPPEETFYVVRRLVAALASARPVVLAIDDLHWAEPLLLDLVEHLVQWGAGTRLLVLAAARPELRDTRSSLVSAGGAASDVVTLSGLDAGAATRLAASVIGADALPAAVAGRVLATSEGNPLFLGELVRMLVNDGALRREGDRWTAAVSPAELEMPPTIHALLAARIERLRAEERLVLERAAVVGRQFSRAAVAHLLPREAHGELDARLESLRRSELIEPDAGWLLGEPALRFHHVLIRDAAYRRVLRNTRAELHARFADWLEARAGESLEHGETIGWHLEQAHEHLRELGPLDAKGRALGERAAGHLAAAGRRALARDDLGPAASLLGRALARLDAADPARAELTLDWCEALLAAGEVGAATGAIDEFGRFGADSERLRAWLTCFRGELVVLTDPQALRATTEAVAGAAEALATAGDGAGEAKAHFVHARALAQLGKIGACEAALDRALAAARRVRDRRRSNAVLAGAPLAALWGPSPVTRASGRCLDVVRVLRITQGAPAVEAVALSCQAVLETLRGRADAARRMIASSRRMVEDLGITQRVLEADLFAGLIELLEGDAVAAERWLRPAYDGLAAHGLGIDAAQAAALLGRALLAQGRAAEAEALSQESEALAGDSFKAAIAWRGVRAEALSARGEHAAAVEIAGKAVEIAAATDDLLDHADARQALAVALRAAGRRAEADGEKARAIELWEAKGATLLAERARREMGRVRPAEAAREPRAEPRGPVRRRVRPNAASADAERLAAAVAARDEAALVPILSNVTEMVEHPTGSVIEGSRLLSVWRALVRSQDPVLRNEVLATLGDSLALVRSCMTFSALRGTDLGPFGETRRDELALVEVGAGGHHQRIELFALERLGDALVRLYERHAELLPAGPERTRLAATARTVAALASLPDVERLAAVLAPDVEWVDARNVGAGSIRGADAVLESMRALIELANDFAAHIDDVICARSDALLVRRTNSGTLRAGGGGFERDLCQLWLFGADGGLTRWEQFDATREAEALARLDALTAPHRDARVRRLHPNAATKHSLDLNAVIAARSAELLPTLFSEKIEVVHHPTGVSFGREGAVRRFEATLAADGLRFAHEPLAALGDSLALARSTTSFARLDEGDIAMGAAAAERPVLIEVDGRGRAQRVEMFAEDRLGDAIVRLYQRYAELLPDGPERTRAAATARSVAALPLQGPFDLQRYAAAFAPGLEWMDHRTAGSGPLHGASEVTRSISTLLELSADFIHLAGDILGSSPGTLLVHHANFGTVRASGGAFERHHLMLWSFGDDGLLARIEQFDADQEDEALARFDALTSAPSRPVRRRVRPNAATANAERLDAAVAARDIDALYATLAESATTFHQPTGALYEERESRRTYEVMLAAENLRFEHEPLATLGDSLALCLGHVSFDASANLVGSVGAANMDSIVLLEVDARGQRVRAEFFATDRLGDAIVRVYERYAERLADGPERIRSTATARTVTAWLAHATLERFEEYVGRSLEFVDHRLGGFGPIHGGEAFLRGHRSLNELARDVSLVVHDVLGLHPDVFLLRTTTSGIDRTSGGAFERPLLLLGTFGADGRIARVEWFDPERPDEALARFDALAAEPPPAGFSNAAVRAQSVLERIWREGRISDVIASLSPDFVLDDRRSVTGLRLSGADFVTNLRVLAEAESSEWRSEPLATRGERLALFHVRFGGVSSNGAEFLEEHLSVFECDASGRWLAVVVFDRGQRDAAYTELEERWATGEGAGDSRAALVRAFRRAFTARDWEGLAALLAPDLVVHDHRLLGWETLHGTAQYVAALRSLVELAPDAQLRIDHVVLSERGLLCVPSWVGTREGGPFEAPSVFVTELDAEGRICRLDQYDPGQLDAARARLAELSGAPGTPAIENAATRMREQVDAAWNARNWTRFAALYPPSLRLSDRRTLVQLELDGDEHLERMRPFSAMDSSQRTTVLATRGNRLALIRLRWQGSDRTVGPSEIEFLAVVELDGAGQQSAMVMFDADQLDAAYAELDERYGAGEGAGSLGWAEQRSWVDAFARRDWEALASHLPPDLEVHDHRALGWGAVGGAGFIDLLRSLVELAPDVRLRLDHFVGCERGALTVARMVGTRDGGEFEIPRLGVREVDGSGRLRRIDHYDLDRLDEAFVRFEALRPDPLRIPPNAATRAMERMGAALAARDMAGVEALCAPELVFDDRRRLNHLRGDRELFLAANRLMAGNRGSRTVLATMGDRLALARLLWLGSDATPFEVEVLDVVEVDEGGRVVALTAFDPEDRRAASTEMFERFHRGEGARSRSPRFIEFMRAATAHDASRARAALPDDFVFHDHRRTGLGRIGNADDYVASLAALWEQSSDATLDTLYFVALADHAALSVGRTFGTLAGGGEFESLYVRLGRFRDGQFAGAEVYELEDLELARKRFEELRPGPLRIPPNAATRTMDRWGECAEASDWQTIEGLCAPACHFEDRRRGMLMSGDRAAFLASARLIASAGSRPARTLLATSGDRLALEHDLWTNPRLGTEVETLELVEVDAEGRIAAVLVFDPEDRRAASREMFERYVGSDAASWMSENQRELTRALRDRDLGRARAALPDDFFFHDHRRTGAGRLETADGYVAWLRTLFEQSPDGIVTNVCYLATEPWGELGIGRTFGTLASGGAFESMFVRLSVHRAGKFAGAELFELEDLERARMRFEALRPDPLRVPENAAARSTARLIASVQAEDWNRVGALLAENVSFEDRRRGFLFSGDRQLMLANLRYIGAGARTTTTLLATAGARLALQRYRFGALNGAAPFEVETLQVAEVDADGRVCAAVVFDPDDRRAASRELFERYARSDEARPMPAAAFEALRAMNDHDLDRLRALLPRDFFFDDHRRTGVGRIEGSEAFVPTVAALFEQAPDLTFETLYTIATEQHGALEMVRMFGRLAAGGGEFETCYARLGLYQGARLVGMELFEPDDLDRARARLTELRPDSLRIPPNAATRASDRVGALLREGNWPALRALTAPDFRFDDRRKLALVSGDVELYIQNLQVVHAYPGLATRREILCTAGDRISLSRLSYTGDPEGSRFEGEFLLLVEVDAAGRLRAATHFDPDDRTAAFIEAHRRFASGEAGVAGRDPVTELGVAFTRHAWEDLRSCLAEDVEICDHRRLGFEPFDRERWLESLAVFAELAPDVRSEPFRILAWNRRGRASLTRVLGTTRDGAEFENLLVSVFLAPGDRILRFEMFEIADVERALARFEELTAG